MRSRRASTVAFLALVFLAGCGRSLDPVAPGGGEPNGLAFGTPYLGSAFGGTGLVRVPLGIGDRWHYRTSFAARPIDPLTHQLGPETKEQGGYAIEVVCEQPIVMRDPLPGVDGPLVYRVASRRDDGDFQYVSWIWYRQDRVGLYERDDTSAPPCAVVTAPTAPAAHAPDGGWQRFAAANPELAAQPGWRRAWDVLAAKRELFERLARASGAAAVTPGEIQRLAYPLAPGRRWTIRDDPRFTARAEANVILRTPAGRFPATSVLIHADLFGPRDVVRTFWGRDGYLGLRAKLYSVATDDQGNPIGEYVATLEETLDELGPVD